MLGIGLDTPSEKDFEKYTRFFLNKNKDIYNSLILKDITENNKDFLKLIVTDLGEILGIMNKYNFNYILLSDDDERKTKIEKVIAFKKKNTLK